MFRPAARARAVASAASARLASSCAPRASCQQPSDAAAAAGWFCPHALKSKKTAEGEQFSLLLARLEQIPAALLPLVLQGRFPPPGILRPEWKRRRQGRVWGSREAEISSS